MSSIASLAQDLQHRDGKPAYVQFSTVAQQLVKESKEQGRYVARDVDMVTVRQIGSTDSVMFKVENWLAQNEIDVKQDRLPAAHAEAYREAYRRWKAGQELPLEGTPIKTWPVISPAQVEVLTRIGIRTVEDLASLSDEGLARVGMGAIDLKNKAKAWMLAGQDKGKLSQEMAVLQRDNATMNDTISKLMEQINELKRLVKVPQAESETITADDIMDAPEPVRGRKR